MASGYVQVPPDSTGKKVDCTSISSGAVRQVIVVGDPTTSSGFATITGGKLNVNASVGGTVTVQGNVSATIIGSLPNINVSAMPAVNISAMPNVVLATGANNIGTVNGISQTVNVAVTNKVVINNISATTLVAGPQATGTTGTGNWPVLVGGLDGGDSGTVHMAKVDGSGNLFVQGTVNISSMPAISVGPISTIDKISQTVLVAITSAINLNISSMPAISVGPISTIDKISQTVVVAGAVTITSGAIDISSMPKVTISGGVSVAVTNNIGVDQIVQPIKVTTMPALTLASGQVLDGISQTVTVVVSGAINISSMPAISVGPISTIDKISQTVVVAGAVTIASGAIDISSMPKVSISGSVLCAVTGSVSIAGTATITGVVTLGAGAANIGTVNNISAAVVLAAGTANIGTLNGISQTVLVQVANVNPLNVNLAGQSGGFVLYVQGGISEGVSATAGNAPVLMGGRVKTSISSTVGSKLSRWAWFDKAGHQIVQMNAACLPPSATHGPKSVTLSASANTVLVASAGTACIFVDSVMVTGNLAGVSRCDVYTQNNSAAPEISAYIGTGGGGFTQKFDPPWQISAGQPLVARLKPSASAQVIATVHFHVGPN